MQKLHASLVKSYINFYVAFEVGEGTQFEDSMALRLYLNSNYRPWWCGLYDEGTTLKCIDDFGGKIISEQQFKEMIERDGLTAFTEAESRKWKYGANHVA